MTTAITFPADPVTNGATVIQTSNFNIVTTDYMSVGYSAVQLFKKRAGIQIDGLPNFANGVATPDWQFFFRKDLANASASFRNLIGLRTDTKTRGVSAFSGALGKVISTNVMIHRVESHNWSPSVVTLTDLTALIVWTESVAVYTFIVDPESGTLLSGDGSHRSMTEAESFLLLKVAGAVPTNGPAINIATGVAPFTFS